MEWNNRIPAKERNGNCMCGCGQKVIKSFEEGQFEVQGSQREPYNIMLDEKYGAFCDCSSFFWRKEECKHIKEVKKWLETHQ